MTQIAHRPIGELTLNLDRKRIPVKAADRRHGPYPYYGASGVVDHVDDYLFEGLHLLVAEDGENLRSRKTPIAFLADGRFWVNNHAHVLQGNGDNDTRYLSYALEAMDISGYVTGSAQPKLSQAALAAIEVPALPLNVQRAIAATLGSLDDKIESNQRAIGVMEDLARSTFEQIFDLDQVDGGVALSDLVNVNPQRVLRSGTPATYVGMSSLPEFSAEVFKWETREAGSGQRFVLGDVLMARITPCLENGKTAVVDMLKPDEVGWGSTEYVVLSPAGLFSTAWIYCLVRDERIRDFAIRSMTGTSGRQRFQADRFSQYRIVSPAAADLVRFNTVVEPMFTRMTQLRDESLKLTALRDALLPELLSGRIRVRAEGVAA
ncbi:restriction endonuclease subunit S [Agromyces archimandritae]|uniref:Restriction endonuclease subunit S n=1 Tax=Agromyces archimandritae TaxID=2781962 RepID=A0A975INK5_9MICO|nr:restriction endonuclease subunit S [Agromyces archimandritae]QTX04703.1 restriction endonuclease subunit S [Agromyces archimandritae]